jgi:hypothetical protein
VRNSDTFAVYLHGLEAREIEFRVLDDGRHWLDITDDVSLIVRPDDDDLAASITGLRKLAAAATEMADALSSKDGAS